MKNALFLLTEAPTAGAVSLGFWDIMLYYGYALLLLALIFTIIAQYKVSSTFNRYSRVQNEGSITGAEAAEIVLRKNGVRGVRIERVGGHLSDHYDPRTNVIRLSEAVYDARTPAAVGVAAHEAGHAVQYAQEYFPVKLRTAIVPTANWMSRLAFPLLLLGFILNVAGLIWTGIIAFSASVIFQLITLPCEFNASRRAVTAIKDSGFFSKNDITGAQKVLTAAAMTYVAALCVSLIYLFRYIALAKNRRR